MKALLFTPEGHILDQESLSDRLGLSLAGQTHIRIGGDHQFHGYQDCLAAQPAAIDPESARDRIAGIVTDKQ